MTRYEATRSLVGFAVDLTRLWIIGASPSAFERAVEDLELALKIWHKVEYNRSSAL